MTMIQQLRDGDEHVYQILFKYMMPYAISLYRNQVLAEEAVQEMNIKIWKNLSRITATTDSALRSLARRILYNDWISRWRRNNKVSDRAFCSIDKVNLPSEGIHQLSEGGDESLLLASAYGAIFIDLLDPKLYGEARNNGVTSVRETRARYVWSWWQNRVFGLAHETIGQQRSPAATSVAIAQEVFRGERCMEYGVQTASRASFLPWSARLFLEAISQGWSEARGFGRT
jgi:hypothetical protein